MTVTFRRVGPVAGDGAEAGAERARLLVLLTEEEWPFHTVPRPDPATVRGWLDGRWSGHAFWILRDGATAGLLRLIDPDDDTPLFDLRIRAAHRGHGLGGHALHWLTGHVFTACPGARRIEGTTRQDNTAMRRTFHRCGYVQEAHYREAWPDPSGTLHDSVGYAKLRRDWVDGTTTPVRWDRDRDGG
ncbi:GNAT family N-acetyltransferase [Streptomyces sp. NPDC058045]|uniref:GNAT family N-acetyltransferase n=1 Tax=Streptomyces sp. NPDC058045 TaxID=3346311 RepID=UPI0036E0D5DF